jgi:DNA polymerase III epsilon subunit-like protein
MAQSFLQAVKDDGAYFCYGCSDRQHITHRRRCRHFQGPLIRNEAGNVGDSVRHRIPRALRQEVPAAGSSQEGYQDTNPAAAIEETFSALAIADPTGKVVHKDSTHGGPLNEKPLNENAYGPQSKLLMFIDTETTGFSSKDRVVQIAWRLYAEDTINLVSSNCYIVKPTNYQISAKSTKIHRITQERALREGLEIGIILQEFKSALLRSDVVIAHNMKFDDRMISSELRRLEDQTDLFNLWTKKTKFCTMKRARSVFGFRLSDLYSRLTGKALPENMHSADVDTDMCAQVYFKLKENQQSAMLTNQIMPDTQVVRPSQHSTKLVDAFTNFSVVEIETFMKEILGQVSFHDLSNRYENSYHMLYLGSFLTLFYGRRDVIVSSNREAGNGRYDIRIEIRDLKKAILFEFKRSALESHLERDAGIALEQIVSYRYASDLSGYSCLLIGVAFHKKAMSHLKISTLQN